MMGLETGQPDRKHVILDSTVALGIMVITWIRATEKYSTNGVGRSIEELGPGRGRAREEKPTAPRPDRARSSRYPPCPLAG
jgi:hypothetical protein